MLTGLPQHLPETHVLRRSFAQTLLRPCATHNCIVYLWPTVALPEEVLCLVKVSQCLVAYPVGACDAFPTELSESKIQFRRREQITMRISIAIAVERGASVAARWRRLHGPKISSSDHISG